MAARPKGYGRRSSRRAGQKLPQEGRAWVRRVGNQQRSYLSAAQQMNFGAEVLDEGVVRFRLWAPKKDQIWIVLGAGAPLAMRSAGHGWHELVSSEARPGTLYKFQLEKGGLQVPDPAYAVPAVGCPWTERSHRPDGLRLARW